MSRVAARQWLEVVRFELVYQLRRRSTWVLFAVFLLPLLGQTNGQVFEAQGGEVLFDAPVVVAESAATLTLIALLVLAALAGDAATRDVQLRVEPLIHAAPLSPTVYLSGRFAGALAVGALLMAATPLASLLARWLHPGLGPEHLAPLRPAAYLQAYLLLVLPNVFVATALLFALAARVRHTLGAYLGAVLVLAGTVLSRGFVADALGRWDLARYLDPTGISAVGMLKRTWSPIDLDARLIGTDAALLWNRLLWLAVALAVLALAVFRFRFGGRPGGARWRWRGGRSGRLRTVGAHGGEAAAPGLLAGVAVVHSAPVAVPAVARRFGPAARLRQTLALTRDSLREIVTGWSWLVLPFLALQIAVHPDLLEAVGVPTFPTTARVLEVFDDLPTLIFVVLMAGELVWRERDANVQAFADTAPVPSALRFLGKVLGLWIAIAAVHALLIGAGVLVQAGQGWTDFDLPLYVRVLLGLELIEALVFALAALSIHVLVNHKHVGHLGVLLFVWAARALPTQLGIEHPLLIYGAGPAWHYSAISGFGPYLGPVLWFQLYWAAWTLLLAIVAGLFWMRGVERGAGERLRLARRRLRGPAAAAAAAALGLFVAVGGFVFYNTNVLNAYRSTAGSEALRAEYERRYGTHRDAPQPQLAALELEVDLHPDRRRAEVRGVHRLENRTPRPIDTLHLATSSAVETAALGFDRPARAVLVDDDLGHRTYLLAEPLQPGDSLAMRWQVRYAPRGFPARDLDTAVVENGSFIVLYEWMPLVGYQSGRELSDPAQRRRHGLPARPEIPPLDDPRAPWGRSANPRVALEVTVTTAADQIAVAPGALRRAWTRDGRRTFHYASSAPVGLGFAIFSADYAVRKARWGDVALEVVHHPPHDHNVERMIRGMRASLEQLGARFGPYPFDVLRMVEYPEPGGNLHAASATIWYKELFSLFHPERDPRRIDLPFAIVAHEVAHQWWGGRLAPARVEGIALLSESLAWYSALGVIEHEHGRDHLDRFLAFLRESYLDPRSRADVPLLRASDWFAAYRKGPFAMFALRESVGEERVDRALRNLLARHPAHEPPFATSLDLYRELQAVTPEELRPLLADLFERNTFWELETRRATARRRAGGEWRVSLEVMARKVVVDEEGAETEMPMDDLVEIGVFAPAEGGEARGVALHLALHRVRSGAQTITVDVPRRPALAGVDPRHLLIDVEPGDNVVEVEEGAELARGATAGRSGAE